MKTIKLFLIVTGIMMLVALGAVGYVWFQLQTISHQQTEQVSNTQGAEIPVVPEAGVPTTDKNDDVPTLGDAVLNEGQKKVLDTFGINADAIKITDTLMRCAKDALGIRRYNEILSGAIPGPLESLKLLGCTKK